MGSENLRSAGMQFTPRGIISGTVIVDGATGLPNDAVNPVYVNGSVALSGPITLSGPVTVSQPVTSVSDLIRNDYTSIAVTTSVYVQIKSSTSAAIKKLEIFDSSGQTLLLATGASGSEVNLLYITPGGNGQIAIDIPAGTRLSIKAVSANATSGELDINAYNIV
jgi:hypothetical protein